jgi:hypothetical protein
MNGRGAGRENGIYRTCGCGQLDWELHRERVKSVLSG